MSGTIQGNVPRVVADLPIGGTVRAQDFLPAVRLQNHCWAESVPQIVVVGDRAGIVLPEGAGQLLAGFPSRVPESLPVWRLITIGTDVDVTATVESTSEATTNTHGAASTRQESTLAVGPGDVILVTVDVPSGGGQLKACILIPEPLEYMADTSIPTADLTWAYSVARRLHSDYTGPLIRAVRLSDNAERDIGADAQWDLDTADLLSWSGTDDVRIDTIYDQSGNGRDQKPWSTTAKTAWHRIANDGDIVMKNGRPAADCVTAMIYRWDNGGSNLFLANDLTCYTVCSHDGSGGTKVRTIWRSVNSSNNRFFGLRIRPSEEKWRHFFRGTGATNPELSVAMDSVTRLFTGQQRGDGTTELWVDGTSVATSTATVAYGAGAVLDLGGAVGTFQELAIYRDAHDNTVRGEVDGIITDYYGLA